MSTAAEMFAAIGPTPVIVASPCSGHGFKFAPVIGEVLADLVIEDRTDHDINLFTLNRFASV